MIRQVYRLRPSCVMVKRALRGEHGQLGLSHKLHITPVGELHAPVRRRRTNAFGLLPLFSNSTAMSHSPTEDTSAAKTEHLVIAMNRYKTGRGLTIVLQSSEHIQLLHTSLSTPLHLTSQFRLLQHHSRHFTATVARCSPASSSQSLPS